MKEAYLGPRGRNVLVLSWRNATKDIMRDKCLHAVVAEDRRNWPRTCQVLGVTPVPSLLWLPFVVAQLMPLVISTPLLAPAPRRQRELCLDRRACCVVTSTGYFEHARAVAHNIVWSRRSRVFCLVALRLSCALNFPQKLTI